jgi:hypothetical protein
VVIILVLLQAQRLRDAVTKLRAARAEVEMLLGDVAPGMRQVIVEAMAPAVIAIPGASSGESMLWV